MTKMSLPQQWLTFENQYVTYQYLNQAGGKINHWKSPYSQNKEEKAYDHLTVNTIQRYSY